MLLGALIGPATDTFAATAVVWRLVAGILPPAPSDPGPPGRRPRDVARLLPRPPAAEPHDRYPTTEWAAATGSLATATRRRRRAPWGSPSPSRVRPVSYKGLAAFQPEDAALFFGREELVDKLVSRMQARRRSSSADRPGAGSRR